MNGEKFKIKNVFSLNKKYKSGSKNKSFLHPKKKIKSNNTLNGIIKKMKTDYNI